MSKIHKNFNLGGSGRGRITIFGHFGPKIRFWAHLGLKNGLQIVVECSVGSVPSISRENYDEKSEHDTEELHAKEDFLKSITRGRLLEPSYMLYVICCHGWTLFAELSQQERNKILLLSFHYPKCLMLLYILI